MTNYARIQHHIDKGDGIAGKKCGPPFAAYRVGPTSSGDYPSGWTQLASSVFVYREVIRMGTLQYALKAATTIWYNVYANMEPYLLGDVFQSSDAAYSPGVSYGAGATSIAGSYEFDAFTLAWHPPAMVPVGARVDRRCRIYRPMGQPDVASNADGSQTNIWRQTERMTQAGYLGQALVLANGRFSFIAGASNVTASYVPIGMASNERPPRGDNFPPGYPGVTPTPHYFGFLPYLPGYEPNEGDRIITEDGARYVVTNPFRQEAGVVGSQLSLNRVIGQNA